jgi:hypothetical protein
VRRDTFALLHYFGSGEGFNKQMHMLWLNGTLNNIPSVFLAFVLDQRFAILGYIASKDRFSTFGCPHQMIEDQVHPMFISLVTVLFHVHKFNTTYKACPLKFG